MVFESLRNAWRQAVDNFWEELQSDEAPADARTRAMYTQVAAARNEMGRLRREISDCRRSRDAERTEAEVCARRERMAKDIGDGETARIAAEFRARHHERSEVLGRKLEALEAEEGLWRRDLEEMEQALQRIPRPHRPPELDDLNHHPREPDFQDLERAARERAAADRLEELKRRRPE